MRRVALILVLALTLAGASEAGAHTTIIEPPGSHYPYQQWVDEARVPTPNATITLFEDESGCAGQGIRCTAQGAFAIWLTPWIDDWRMVRRAFLHELGHNFDYYELSDPARFEFGSLLGDRRPWATAPNPAKEKFAEAYMWCALRVRIRRPPNEWGYRYRPTPRLHSQVCRLIRHAGQLANRA